MGAQSFTDNPFHEWTLTARPDFSIAYNCLLDATAIALVLPCGATENTFQFSFLATARQMFEGSSHVPLELGLQAKHSSCSHCSYDTAQAAPLSSSFSTGWIPALPCSSPSMGPAGTDHREGVGHSLYSSPSHCHSPAWQPPSPLHPQKPATVLTHAAAKPPAHSGIWAAVF